MTAPPADGTDPFGLPFERPGGGMDVIGWFIATLHQLAGHDCVAAVCGGPACGRSRCVICLYENDPTPERKQAVIDAIGRPA